MPYTDSTPNQFEAKPQYDWLYDGDKQAATTPEGSTMLNATQRELQEEAVRTEMLRLLHDQPHHEERQKLAELLEEARINNEHYVIPNGGEQRPDQMGSNHERVLTMARSVGQYGLLAAQKHNITPGRVRLTERLYQTSIDAGEASTTIDAGALVTTALSLREMADVSNDAADQQSAREALDLLRDVLEGSEHAMPRFTEGAGPDTGETALAAIASYRPAARDY